MSGETEAFPHIYHTVSELKTVKDVRLLKNTHVKTIGYFLNGKLHDVSWEKSQSFMDTENSIALDLTHLDLGGISPNKPYLITAIIFTTDFLPVLTVKTAKKMDTDLKMLLSYHQQLLSVRRRTYHFEDLKKIAHQNEWI